MHLACRHLLLQHLLGWRWCETVEHSVSRWVSSDQGVSEGIPPIYLRSIVLGQPSCYIHYTKPRTQARDVRVSRFHIGLPCRTLNMKS